MDSTLRTKTLRRTAATIAVVAGSALFLAACSSGSASSTSGAAIATPTNVVGDAESASIFKAPTIESVGLATASVEGDTVSIDVGDGKTIELPKDGPHAIAVFVTGYGNAYAAGLEEGVNAAAEAYGVTVDVFDPKGDVGTQRNQIEAAITSGKYDMFAISAIDDTECSTFQKAMDAGILITAVAQAFCGHNLGGNADLWMPGTLNYVGGTTNADAYQAYADQVVKEFPDSKAIVLVGPQAVSAAVLAEDAIRSAAEGTDFQIAAIGNTNFTKETGFEQTQNLLQANPDVDLVVTFYSELSLGAAQAIKQAGKSDSVSVVDYGGSKAIVDLIGEGQVALSVPFYPYSVGFAGVESLVLASQGVSVPRLVLNDGHALLDDTQIVDFYTEDTLADATPEY